ncbi:MAG: ethanolamine ammonia-lyase reactivating factor EutA, partial [Christensenellales bacterium]|nr:ethanolamine ammonia-lyase reactivating factor EutA [Christensenellales bacterium]
MGGETLLSVGIDIGTSTTQTVFSRIVLSNTAPAFSIPRIQITEKTVLFRAPICLTPLLRPDTIDAEGVRALVADAYRQAGVRPAEIGCGAVIITGETARKQNARAVLE